MLLHRGIWFAATAAIIVPVEERTVITYRMKRPLPSSILLHTIETRTVRRVRIHDVNGVGDEFEGLQRGLRQIAEDLVGSHLAGKTALDDIQAVR